LTTYAERQQEAAFRDEIVRVCRLLWEKDLVAASDGNASIRLSPDRVLVTPSGLSKGFLAAADVVLTDMDGKPVQSFYRGDARRKPTSEIILHLEVYRQRPDVRAVLHAHPPIATAFSIAGVSLAQCVLPEVIVNLGSIPTTAYATPSTAEGAEVIRDLIHDYDALILDRHGTVTVGPNLFDAYMKLEKVEHLASITLTARQLGRVGLLPQEEVRRLVEIRRQKLGLPPDYEGPGCVLCGACGREGSPGNVSDDELVRQVAATVARELGKQLS
jgi:L-fuculose-phosphate aldolase